MKASLCRTFTSSVTQDWLRLEISHDRNFGQIFYTTRSYAALRAADLDWIVGPGYSLGRVHSDKNVTDAGSQMTWEGGRAGISKNVTHAGSQLTF